ncbi:MAG: zinc ABC transporter substrate-binding protein [Geminicoccaceae bacterium]
MRPALRPSLVSLSLLLAGPAAAAEPPQVVASILPIQSIAASVMGDRGTPRLLLEPGTSPHAASLKPSQAAMLDGADLVLWVGPELEAFLERPLEALGGDARVIALAATPGIERLPYREGPIFDEAGEHANDHAHAAGHEHGDEHDHADEHDDGHHHGTLDAHIWLSPENARVMAGRIARELGELDPENAGLYAANAEAFDRSLDAVEAEIRTMVEPLRGRPFIVFHDAYHGFEHHFDIEAAGAVHVTPDVQPGAARVAELRSAITETGAVCVFTEPQFEPRLVATLIEGTKAGTGTLDPLGTDLEPGPDAYPELLLGLARGLEECLGG